MDTFELNLVDSNGNDQYSIVWCDGNLDESNASYQQSLMRLRQIINDVHLYKDPKQCIDFITDCERRTLVVITSRVLAEELIPAIHSISSLQNIYIFDQELSDEESWMRSWWKLRGIHKRIDSICLDMDVNIFPWRHPIESLNVDSLLQDLNNICPHQCEHSLVWSKLVLKIVRTMADHPRCKQIFVQFMRETLPQSYHPERIVNDFERDYCSTTAISWYTRESFINSVLNRALQSLQIDVILVTGFFIRDLCQQIEQLHRVNVHPHSGHPFTVYRGQSVPANDLERIRQDPNGFICFNSFLSTYPMKEIALMFADIAEDDLANYGILFVIHIDPRLRHIAFADIKHLSYFPDENEILFNPHCVFRVNEIQRLPRHERLFQVTVTLTDDLSETIDRLNNCIEERMTGLTGALRINQLLLLMGRPGIITQGNFEWLYESSADQEQRCFLSYQRGMSYLFLGNYSFAATHLMEALRLAELDLRENDPKRIDIHVGIGTMHRLLGNYFEALFHFEKALHLKLDHRLDGFPDYSEIVNELGRVYYDMGYHTKAFSFYSSAFHNQQKDLLKHLLTFPVTCNNLGLVYETMGKLPEALSFHQLSLTIRKRILDADHPDLASSYHHMGRVYQQMKDFSTALPLHEQSLNIRKRIFPPNHPELANTYHCLAEVYHGMKEYTQASSFCQNACEIRKQQLPHSHPDLALSFQQLGLFYYDSGNCELAMKCMEEALAIQRKVLPLRHRDVIKSTELLTAFQRNAQRFFNAMTQW